MFSKQAKFVTQVIAPKKFSKECFRIGYSDFKKYIKMYTNLIKAKHD